MTTEQDAYRRVAGLYDRIFEPMNKGLRLLGLRMYRPQPSMQILDVGCGTGAHLEIYKRFGCELHGLDASPAMLEVAQKRLGRDADLRLGDATQMPYEDGAFDLVYSMLVLHEMDQEIRISTLAEMGRVLKSDGRLLLIDFHTGPAKFWRGWWTKAVIFLSEVAAGRRHFRNYRHFMAIGGLRALFDETGVTIDSHQIVGGGTLALYLLEK